MPESKTKPTAASVDEYLASRASPAQLVDCRALIAICERVTKQPPVMWGASIVGFGRYHYTYDSGHSGDMCLTGLAVRGRELVVYVTTDNTGRWLRASASTAALPRVCTSSASPISMSMCWSN